MADLSRNWYEHQSESLPVGANVTILWNFSINADRTIQATRPDIIIKEKKNCTLVDMSVTSDKNISSKVFFKTK